MSRSDSENDMDEFVLAEMPSDADEFVLAETPSAPAPASDTPSVPELKRQRAASTEAALGAERSSGRASSVAAAIFNCNLNEPKIEATLEYESYPTTAEGVPKPWVSYTKIRVDVTPSEHLPKPSSADVVLCLDASMSMGKVSAPGSGAALLKDFLIGLIKNGVPGLTLNLRILEFGRVVVDRRTDDVLELVRLDDSSRDKFMAVAEQYSPTQGCTDISSPVNHAIGAIRAHHIDRKERGVTPSDVAHVICLTDGVANSGLRSGSACLGAARHAMSESDIFVHYIGLGSAVDADFMTQATADGDAGVFSVAPDAFKISHAFEEVFGLALATTLPLTLEVVDANGMCVEKKGMLIKKRSLLLDVALPFRTDPCVANDISVRLKIGGQYLTELKQVPVTYSEAGFGNSNTAVKELIEAEAIKSQIHDIMKHAPDMETASQSIRGMIRKKEASGEYSANSLSRAAAAADDVDGAAVAYRSCGSNGCHLFAARMSSQSAYA
jgi:Mg-chelatase subunit ChlD